LKLIDFSPQTKSTKVTDPNSVILDPSSIVSNIKENPLSTIRTSLKQTPPSQSPPTIDQGNQTENIFSPPQDQIDQATFPLPANQVVQKNNHIPAISQDKNLEEEFINTISGTSENSEESTEI